MKQKRRTSKFLVLPDEQVKGPSVVIETVPMEQGGALKGVRKYLVTTRRGPPNGEWAVEIILIDENDKSLVTRLPNGVVQMMNRHRESIIKDCRSAAGRRAYDTAVEKGTAKFPPRQVG